MRRIPSILVAILLSIALAACGDVLGGSDRSLGTFQACLHRIVDRCASSSDDCRSRISDGLTVELSESETGVLRWSVDGATVLEGRRAGRRFELSSVASIPASICGCDALVTERVLGELLLPREVTPSCNFPDEASSCGPQAQAVEPRLLVAPLPGDGWLEGGEESAGESAGESTSFGTLHAVVVESVTFADGASCGCNDCGATFELTGVQ